MGFIRSRLGSWDQDKSQGWMVLESKFMFSSLLGDASRSPVWVQTGCFLLGQQSALPRASFHKRGLGWASTQSSLVGRLLPCIVSQTLLHPHSWVVGNWTRCSRSCDAGVRSRSVVCQRRVSAAEEKALDDSACPQPRPPVLEACHGPACPPEWAALDWSEVSLPCLPAHPHAAYSQCREGRQGPRKPMWTLFCSHASPRGPHSTSHYSPSTGPTP
jgi:hypothetical protein